MELKTIKRKVINWLQTATVIDVVLSCILLTSMIVICDYQTGITEKVTPLTYKGMELSRWNVLWVIGENGMLLVMSAACLIYTVGLFRMLSLIVVIFSAIKLIFQIACFLSVKVMPRDDWNVLWYDSSKILGVVLSLIIIISLFRGAFLIHKRYVKIR